MARVFVKGLGAWTNGFRASGPSSVRATRIHTLFSFGPLPYYRSVFGADNTVNNTTYLSSCCGACFCVQGLSEYE